MRGVCVRKEQSSVYVKNSISRNAEPSSDAPQTKQTKHLIRLIVRDIPQLNVCVLLRAPCVVNSAQATDTKNPSPYRVCSKMSHR